MACPSPEATPEETQADALRKRLEISRTIIGISVLPLPRMRMGTHCQNPKKSTGAGDRFDAGICLALGGATSGFFVRNARCDGKHKLRLLIHDGTGHKDLHPAEILRAAVKVQPYQRPRQPRSWSHSIRTNLKIFKVQYPENMTESRRILLKTTYRAPLL